MMDLHSLVVPKTCIQRKLRNARLSDGIITASWGNGYHGEFIEMITWATQFRLPQKTNWTF